MRARARRPWRSLTGRIALTLAAALLVAQALSLALLTRAQGIGVERETAAIAATVLGARMDEEAGAGPFAGPRGEAMRRRFERRRGRLVTVEATGPTEGASRGRLVPLVAARLAEAGHAPGEIEVRRAPLPDRPLGGRFAGRGRQAGGEGLLVAARTGPGTWLTVRVPIAGRPPRAFAPLTVQTVLVYLAVLIPLLWVGRRITRPINALTSAARGYVPGRGASDVPATGPDDVADLGRALRALQKRVEAGLAERDAMLGAIGHDLRTPITSLRLRAEQVGDEALRGKMIATLALARSGAPSEPATPTRLDALLEEVTGAARAAGQRVAVAATVHPTALRRAMQNLVQNADRYAGGGTIGLRTEGDEAVLSVTDEGPGLPAGFDPLAAFSRGEASRNRASGGSGLGLAIAARVAEAHGGRLSLTPRPGGGLSAAIRVPIEGPQPPVR